MASRGRKSTASLSVIKSIPKRPDPPGGLTKAQATEWRAIVGRLPVDWFPRETHPLLVEHVRHIEIAETIAKEINAFDTTDLATPEGLKRYDRLLRIADRESRAIAALATKLRLTQQSKYSAKSAATAAGSAGDGRRPWETE